MFSSAFRITFPVCFPQFFRYELDGFLACQLGHRPGEFKISCQTFAPFQIRNEHPGHVMLFGNVRLSHRDNHKPRLTIVSSRKCKPWTIDIQC
jgi:hypothetical protein